MNHSLEDETKCVCHFCKQEFDMTLVNKSAYYPIEDKLSGCRKQVPVCHDCVNAKKGLYLVTTEDLKSEIEELKDENALLKNRIASLQKNTPKTEWSSGRCDPKQDLIDALERE